MSILEKCEKIGMELRKTKEGQIVFKYLNIINNNPQELIVEFFRIINHHYVRIHFFSVPNAIDILKLNTENNMVGSWVNEILNMDGVEEFGKANIPLGQFTKKLSIMSFNSFVKYQLPADITATPELIRLSNLLTVECQRINLIQQLIREYYTNPRFSEALKRFDELKGTTPILPFSKEDRKILKALRDEYPDTKVDLVYSLVSILSYIKCMVFDSFYDNIFEIYITADVLSFKERTLDRCKFVKIVIIPNKKTIGPNTGWILKIYYPDNSFAYAQIFSKEIKFTQTDCTITIKALIHDYL